MSDTSLFIHHHPTTPIYLIVYVDDIIITGPNSTHLDMFIKTFVHRFALKDLSDLSYFLGVEVMPTSHGLFFKSTTLHY